MEKYIAQSLNLSLQAVANTLQLLAEGATIPFISRYRKEVTGGLDDATLRDLNDRLEYLRNIEKRKEKLWERNLMNIINQLRHQQTCGKKQKNLKYLIINYQQLFPRNAPCVAM